MDIWNVKPYEKILYLLAIILIALRFLKKTIIWY